MSFNKMDFSSENVFEFQLTSGKKWSWNGLSRLAESEHTDHVY